MFHKNSLNPYRFFDADENIRRIAKDIYDSVENVPIVSPHGHVDPRIFSDNKPFPNPTELFLIPDHYIYRMLYSQGIKLEDMGVPTIDGTLVETDPLKVWKIFAQNYHLFLGTPSGVWLEHEFKYVFGIKEKLGSSNAEKIYNEISEKIKSQEFLPRQLFEKFNIEVITTTDAATDSLENHKKIAESDWNGKVIPCFRPDGITDLSYPNWKDNISDLGEMVGYEILDYSSYIKAIEDVRAFFKSMGATSTDHGVFSPFTFELSADKASELFQKALNGSSTEEDAKLFTAHMLMEMARMSCEDGLTMQIHPGSFRNHNERVFNKFGLDKGCDIPMQTEYTNNLKPLLNKYGNNPEFILIVFTLDETNYARELAPLAGHYPAMKLGPAWWFNDSIEGMTRYRKAVTETAGFYNTVGFNDDTRAFLSIPARHDVARRIDANYLAGLVSRHILSVEEALKIMQELTYGLVKKAYRL